MQKYICGYAPLIVLIAALGLSGCAEKSTASSANASANRAIVADYQGRPVSSRGEDRIAREVRHELVMLPYYGVFDNLAYRVNGGVVTLYGQVSRPTLKSDAGNVVKKIEGVERVVN